MAVLDIFLYNLQHFAAMIIQSTVLPRQLDKQVALMFRLHAKYFVLEIFKLTIKSVNNYNIMNMGWLKNMGKNYETSGMYQFFIN